jgi:sugar lactone lactonase YvrE
MPWGVAVDSSGNVYVADSGNQRIQKFNSSGEFITKWGTFGSGDGQFNYPLRVAVDSSGNVYVADEGNQRIQKFTSNGTFITKWGSGGSGDGQIYSTAGVAVDPFSGNVYVVDRNNNRIQKFSTTDGINYTFITKWGTEGSGDGQFAYPSDVAVDPSGNVYVSDENAHRIQKFDFAGTFITKWGTFGRGDGQFLYPEGVAVDSSGYVYVVDLYNCRIQKFALVNTRVGADVKVLVDGITTTFSNVTAAGVTTVTVTETGPSVPGYFGLLGKYYDISTTATYSGTITIPISYDDSGLSPAREEKLKLQQYVDGSWVDITKSIDTVNNVITGATSHLSYFAVMGPLYYEPITGNPEVDAAMCVLNNKYTDPETGLSTHGTYVSAVTNKIVEMRMAGKITKAEGGEIVKKAAQSSVNMPK